MFPDLMCSWCRNVWSILLSILKDTPNLSFLSGVKLVISAGLHSEQEKGWSEDYVLTRSVSNLKCVLTRSVY